MINQMNFGAFYIAMVFILGLSQLSIGQNNSKIALKAHNGQYLVAEGGGFGKVLANRPKRGLWETFTLVDLGSNKVALKSYNGQYLVAGNGVDQIVRANRYEIGPWETFTLIDRGDNKIALKAYNGQYVVAEEGGGGAVNANRTQIGPWETFTIEVVGIEDEGTVNQISDRITPQNGTLKPGDRLVSKNGYFHAVLQGDGNFVVYYFQNKIEEPGGIALWGTGTYKSGSNVTLILQGDGNLVLYKKGQGAIWETNTAGKGNILLTLTDDGQLILYAAGEPAWWSPKPDAIQIVSLSCTRTSEAKNDEIYFQLPDGSYISDYNINFAKDDEVYLNYIHPIAAGGPDGTGKIKIWEDDDPGDDLIGELSCDINDKTEDLRSIKFTGDGSSYTLKYRYLHNRFSFQPEFFKKQQYSFSDIPSLFDDVNYRYQRALKNCTVSSAGTPDVINEPIPSIHVQGMAITESGRIILSHDTYSDDKKAGRLAYSKDNGYCFGETEFSGITLPGGEGARHPSTMQACGDYLAVAVTGDKARFYKSDANGLTELTHLAGSIGGEGGIGIVYSDKDKCYYVITAQASDESSTDILTLYKSSTSNLEDTNCRFTKEKEFNSCWGSSTGTHLLIQDDGTLFVLVLYSSWDGIMTLWNEEFKLSTLNISTGECLLVKEGNSLYKGSNMSHTPCFRFGSAVQLSGSNCYLVGAKRNIRGSGYMIEYHQTNE